MGKSVVDVKKLNNCLFMGKIDSFNQMVLPVVNISQVSTGFLFEIETKVPFGIQLYESGRIGNKCNMNCNVTKRVAVK